MTRSRLLLLALLTLLVAPVLVNADDSRPSPPERPASNSLAIGATPPMKHFAMKNVDGKDLTIADVQGKRGTLVIFTCNHCPFAQAWQSRIAALGNAALGRGIGVIAINANDPADYPVDDFDGTVARAKLLHLKFPYVIDGTSEVARAFGATRTPEAFLFDAEGKLVYHGAIDDNAKNAAAVKQPYLRTAVDAVVAGKPVPVAETKFIGCSIKFRPQKPETTAAPDTAAE